MDKEFVEIPAGTKVWSIKIQQNIYLENPIYGEIAHTTYGSDWVFVQTFHQIFGTWVENKTFGEIGVSYSMVKPAEKKNDTIHYIDYKYESDK